MVASLTLISVQIHVRFLVEIYIFTWNPSIIFFSWKGHDHQLVQYLIIVDCEVEGIT